ncbi:alpha/beta fold hydrolase BchO [Aurantiacibacter spongiae]|uniref:Alpha/beta fold hydrolase n=1 Tax=Aurantiacibacter spongiae TaxID=2488860 RepID=A0A3N5DAM9_9SPHN|nr:alpha/beta fold hydrolase BchO [Aurantiacibacter spongiae]RPF71748.1 alpha/beta fold hydrolase [Aurantiacibacter spongiae]
MTRPRWEVDGRDWPARESSRFVRAGGIEWHLQIDGGGPVMLLLHGTGASTHSWAPLRPFLAPDWTLVAPDLPGHGFSSQRAGGRATLPFVARAVGALLETCDMRPAVIVGHSAGAAIAVRMALDGIAVPERIVSLAGALLPFGGAANRLFPAAAKLLFLNPFVPSLLAWGARGEGMVERMLEQTGSTLPVAQREIYARLFRHSSHVDASLALMANWDLDTLAADLPDLPVPLDLVFADKDAMVAPDVARRVAALVHGSSITRLEGVGHLAHEEAPERVARVIRHLAGISDPSQGD